MAELVGNLAKKIYIVWQNIKNHNREIPQKRKVHFFFPIVLNHVTYYSFKNIC